VFLTCGFFRFLDTHSKGEHDMAEYTSGNDLIVLDFVGLLGGTAFETVQAKISELLGKNAGLYLNGGVTRVFIRDCESRVVVTETTYPDSAFTLVPVEDRPEEFKSGRLLEARADMNGLEYISIDVFDPEALGEEKTKTFKLPFMVIKWEVS
jgi:hypothetical protein